MVWDVPFGRTDPRDFGGVDRDPGSGGGIPPNFIFPAAPRDVKVVVSHVGIRPSLTITWTDETVIQPAQPTVHHWQVRYADEKVVGTISNETNFPNRVLGLSRYLGTVASTHRGEPLTHVHTEEGMKDGYVTIVGSTEFGIAGPPSMPWLVRVESSSKALAPDVTDLDATYYIERVNGANYINFTPTFRAPADIFFFRGVQVYWNPYVIDDLAEMGNTDIYTGASAAQLQTSPFRRFPLTDNLSLGIGTATTSISSPDVVRVTGTPFDASWIGRPFFFVQTTNGIWPKYSVLSVADGDHLTMNAEALASDTISFLVLKPVTAYYVAIANYGVRRNDITGAPSITL